jgi:hypothetical protein
MIARDVVCVLDRLRSDTLYRADFAGGGFMNRIQEPRGAE